MFGSKELEMMRLKNISIVGNIYIEKFTQYKTPVENAFLMEKIAMRYF